NGSSLGSRFLLVSLFFVFGARPRASCSASQDVVVPPRQRTATLRRVKTPSTNLTRRQPQRSSRVGNLNDRHASATSTHVTRRQRQPTSRGVNVTRRQ